ncbi:hypothetical protein, partial [Streptomyces sp. ADI93-02]|uniref:hypothetical protein n=1 Tax=Streptomyces sp. ADI93-02 TaxID=1522757 RepID=UPI0019D2892B
MPALSSSASAIGPAPFLEHSAAPSFADRSHRQPPAIPGRQGVREGKSENSPRGNLGLTCRGEFSAPDQVSAIASVMASVIVSAIASGMLSSSIRRISWDGRYGRGMDETPSPAPRDENGVLLCQHCQKK